MPYGLYGAWLTVDFRLLWFGLILSIGISLIILAFFIQNRRWHEYLTLFMAISTITFLLTLLVLRLFFGHSIIVTRDFFPLN